MIVSANRLQRPFGFTQSQTTAFPSTARDDGLRPICKLLGPQTQQRSRNSSSSCRGSSCLVMPCVADTARTNDTRAPWGVHAQYRLMRRWGVIFVDVMRQNVHKRTAPTELAERFARGLAWTSLQHSKPSCAPSMYSGHDVSSWCQAP